MGVAILAAPRSLWRGPMQRFRRVLDQLWGCVAGERGTVRIVWIILISIGAFRVITNGLSVFGHLKGSVGVRLESALSTHAFLPLPNHAFNLIGVFIALLALAIILRLTRMMTVVAFRLLLVLLIGLSLLELSSWEDWAISMSRALNRYDITIIGPPELDWLHDDLLGDDLRGCAFSHYKGHQVVMVYPWYRDRVDRIARLLRESGYTIRVTREEEPELPNLFFSMAARGEQKVEKKPDTDDLNVSEDANGGQSAD